MKKSIIRKLKIGMFGFGIFMGLVFPYYAALFESWDNPLFKLGSFIAGLMIGLFCFAMVKFTLLKEIKKIDAFAESLKNNDLTASIEIDSEDEIGNIGKHLTESTKSIRDLISEILSTSDSVLSSLGQLRTFAGNMNSAAGEISERSHAMTTTSDMINSSSKNISKAVTNTAHSMNEVSGNVTSLTESLMWVNDKCDKELTVTSAVNDQFSETKESIVELSNYSTEISKITEVIKSIADQTNLLAINAAVEAAVAGQHGKSFAVVANEVKILADQSLKSANEISKVMDTIKEVIERSKEAITGSSEEMSELTNLAKEISDATKNEVTILESIQKEIHTSADNVNHVSTSMTENSDGISESSGKLHLVNKAIDTISTDIKNGSQSILTLEEQASRLAKMTHQFKI